MDQTKLIIPKRPPLITPKVEIKTVKDIMMPSHNRTYMLVPFIQSMFPHKDPGTLTWSKESDRYKLRVVSGFYEDDTPIGIPFGAKTRMLLCAITKEVCRTESRDFYLGDSMNQLMDSLGITNKCGGENSDRELLYEQTVRLFNCNLNIFNKLDPDRNLAEEEFSEEVVKRRKRKKTPARSILIVTHDESQSQKDWNKTVTISDEFFQILMKYDKVPLDLNHMKALKRSSLALDLYVWLTWASYWVWVTGDEGPFISWDELRVIFSTYTENYDFKRKASPALKNIQKVYTRLKIVVDDHLGIQFQKNTLPAIDPKDKLILD